MVPRLPSRGPTYALLIGSVALILAAGLALPATLAHPVRASAGSASPPPTIAFGPVADHDPRPPAAYSDVSLVTSPPPPAGTALVASDRGVTPTTITLGVILPSLGAIAAFGINVSQLDPKTQRTYWASAVARVNAAGGIDGRRLQVVYATATILSPDSMRAACRSLTEDHHVFAVANMLGVSGDPVLCVTRDHATPYLAISGEDPSYYRISQGRLVTLEPSTTRSLTLLVDRLDQLGAVRGRTFGVVHDTGPGGVDGALVRSLLRGRGARSVLDAPLGNEDPLIVTGEVTAAEKHMAKARVDTVLLFTNAVYGTVFAAQAQQDRFTPTYAVTDLGFATAGDSFTANMPPAFFRQALAVTTTELGQGNAGLRESRLAAGCRLAYAATVTFKVPRDGGDAVPAIAACALVELFTLGANGAGPNPTRAAFASALARVGAFAVPGFGRGFLAPDHLDAADVVEVARARADCQCWFAVDGFRPAP